MKALLPLKNFDPETTKIGQHFISFFDENTQELYAQYIVGYGKALACYGDLMKKVFVVPILLYTYTNRTKNFENYQMR